MRKYLLHLLYILVLTSLVLVSCAPQATEAPEPTEAPETGPPDLTGETVKIYTICSLSGKYASVNIPAMQGIDDTVAYFNEHGGIFGAQIEVIIEDDGGNVDEAVGIYDRFTGADDNILVMLFCNTHAEEALWARWKEDKIPTIAMAPSTIALYSEEDGWGFCPLPLYSEQLAAFMDYVVANWDSIKPEGAGDEVKLAYVSWPGAFGQASLTPESEAYIESLGVEIVTNEQFEPAPTADATTALLNAQAAGANVIWTNTLAFGPAILLNDLHELGLRDQFLIGGPMVSMDNPIYAFLEDPSYDDGFFATVHAIWWSEKDHPGIQLSWEIAEANERKPEDITLARLCYPLGVDIAKHAIEQAILEVGYENLNGEAVYNALAQMQGYETFHGLTTVDFTDGRRSINVTQIRRLQGGHTDKSMVVQDFVEVPDLRPKP
jgi:ABC-type branched-subunit amino acid transport system substrate-binding protein